MKENDYILIEDLDSLSPTQKQQLLTLFKFMGIKLSYPVSRYLSGHSSFRLSAPALVVCPPNTATFLYIIEPNWNHISKSELEKYLALVNFEDNDA